MQIPAPVKLTRPPLNVHPTLAVPSVITVARPEVDVAVGKYIAPTSAGAGALEVKEMLCPIFETATICCTSTAAANFELPAWRASSTHSPARVNVTTPALIVQPVLEASRDSRTTRPELALAVGV